MCHTPRSVTTSGAQQEPTGIPSLANMLWFPAPGLSELGHGRGPASPVQTLLSVPATISLQILVLFLAGHTGVSPLYHPTQGLFLQGVVAPGQENFPHGACA